MQDVGLSSQEKRVAENILAWVFAALVEAIHVELADERIDVPVAEVFGEDMVLKGVNLFDGELAPIGHPVDDSFVLSFF